MTTDRQLIGSVFERKTSPGSLPPLNPSTSSRTGFPVVQHRSKSAFSRGREALKKNNDSTGLTRLQDVPVVLGSNSTPDITTAPPPISLAADSSKSTPIPRDGNRDEGMWKQISDENEKSVEAMTEEEREQERREIMERFGPGVGELLRKAKVVREKNAARSSDPQSIPASLIPRSEASNEKEGSAIRDVEAENHFGEATHHAIDSSSQEKPNGQLLAARLKLDLSKRSTSSSGKGWSTAPSSPRPVLLSPSRPSSRSGFRKIRFAEVTPDDVHVYESAPPSPRKKALLALPPPPISSDQGGRSGGEGGDIISLGTWKGRMDTGISDSAAIEDGGSDANGQVVNTGQEIAANEKDEGAEEGTPEYIRRRYFPQAPAHDPTLAWMEFANPTNSKGSSVSDVAGVRFDLNGAPIPPNLSSTLPTYLGLHHHADGTLAGYTIDDIFLLSRSTVPAQRATMLSVLAKVARRLGKMKMKVGEAEDITGMEKLFGKEEELRKRILAAGVGAIAERGSVGAMALDVVWECVVGWDIDLLDIDGIELQKRSQDGGGGDAITSLPMEHILAQISDLLATPALSTLSHSRLLSILLRFAKHNSAIANGIVKTPSLIPNVLQTSLLMPVLPNDGSPLVAFKLLISLAVSSRENASLLVEYADALLRFLAMLPETGSHPGGDDDSRPAQALGFTPLRQTLCFYRVLASYGLYSHIATTAQPLFAALTSYVLSLTQQNLSGHNGSHPINRKDTLLLLKAWAELLEAWIVCAVDPHQTTPEHEILWSQVVAWDWAGELRQLRSGLEAGEETWDSSAALCNAEAAWLEGARVNGVRGGEDERAEAVAKLEGFGEGGRDGEVVRCAFAALQNSLDELQPSDGAGLKHLKNLKKIANYGTTTSAILRLWLACLTPRSADVQRAPPFCLPYEQISTLCANLVSHPLWSWVSTTSYPSAIHVFLRPLTALLANFLRLSRELPGITPDLWLAQAFAILNRLQVGDEELGVKIMQGIVDTVTPQVITSQLPQVPSAICGVGWVDAIKPFLFNSIWPTSEIYIAPLRLTPMSIRQSTTLRAPTASSSADRSRVDGLPLSRDWMFSPINHLLRSGTSTVLKSMPASWDASETQVTRASLLLARIYQEVMLRYTLQGFVLSREETIFACMRVFMLEHEQAHDDSVEDVFRDAWVTQLMGDLLSPFTYAASNARPHSLGPAGDLEKVVVRFLGPSTPFYQYFTDFVALYDAISFSHPLFARLLLPPTSMRYPPDYRKHLWKDFGHILRTIRTPIEQVITGSIKEYLWPAEKDPQMIGAYLQSILRGPLEGFLRFIAIHHIACNIWPDLRQEGDIAEEERAEKLLSAVVNGGKLDVVKDVLRYRQEVLGPDLLPPVCFNQEGVWKKSRKDWLERHNHYNIEKLLE